jgi:hypothetical protein
LRPPNTHWIRKFNDRARQATGPGKQVIENVEIRGVQSEMFDVLCYVTELENRINELESKAADSQNIQIEMDGGNF